MRRQSEGEDTVRRRRRKSIKPLLTFKSSVEALRAYEPFTHIHHIAPTPLLMTIADTDVLTPTDLALDAYTKALEPKQLQLLPNAGHFDAYSGPLFEKNAGVQTEFLRQHLCGTQDVRAS